MLVEQTLRNAGSTNCATAACSVSNANQIADAWMLGHLGRLSHLSRLRALVGPEALLMFAEKRLLIKMLAT